jgi:peroxiredoxin
LIVAAFAGSASAQRYRLLGAPAPDFALRSASGPNIRLSEQRGDVVVIAFWSSRCNPCRAQLAELNLLYSTYRTAGFTVFGVNVDDDLTAAREFARAQNVQFPMLFDPSKGVAREYKVDRLPTLIAVDRLGKVRYQRREERKRAGPDYVAVLRKLLDE